MTGMDEARIKFKTMIAELIEIDALPAQQDSDANRYNAKGRELRALVQSWGEGGKEILLPLLSAEPRTRGIAASFLLRLGAADRALPVLHELNSDDDKYGQAALDADSALMIWEKEQSQT